MILNCVISINNIIEIHSEDKSVKVNMQGTISRESNIFSFEFEHWKRRGK